MPAQVQALGAARNAQRRAREGARLRNTQDTPSRSRNNIRQSQEAYRRDPSHWEHDELAPSLPATGDPCPRGRDAEAAHTQQEVSQASHINNTAREMHRWTGQGRGRGRGQGQGRGRPRGRGGTSTLQQWERVLQFD